jgi:three-Cys-motif partner protein
MANDVKLDEIGYWSEVKLDIVKDYAAAYSKILAAQKYQGRPQFTHCYIDAFAGAGIHVSKNTGEFVLGSPINALLLDPPFREYHFIDLNAEKVEGLRENELVKKRGAVVHHGDCNDVLLKELLPNLTHGSYRRALLMLDPYGINLDWQVVKKAGELKTVELFLNFMVMDMNRTVFWRNWDGVSADRQERMDRFWGDRSWKDVVYSRETDLFGDEMVTKKAGNEPIVEAYRERLKNVAGFKFVPEPVPMRNEQGSIVYYLFFAAHNPTAGSIVTKIFDKYRDRAAGSAGLKVSG